MYIGIPQFIFILWMVIDLCILYVNDKESDKYNFRISFISIVILFVVLYFGGFFG